MSKRKTHGIKGFTSRDVRAIRRFLTKMISASEAAELQWERIPADRRPDWVQNSATYQANVQAGFRWALGILNQTGTESNHGLPIRRLGDSRGSR